MIPTAGSSASTAKFSRALSVGASGPDVVALQTALEQRGLLELPPGVANGFFGALTQAAVAAYQAHTGLPSIGVFGPLTTAKLNAELAGNPILPNTGAEAIATSSSGEDPPVSPLSLPILIQSAQSAFATPLDGLITLLLLIAIGFVVSEIVRRR